MRFSVYSERHYIALINRGVNAKGRNDRDPE